MKTQQTILRAIMISIVLLIGIISTSCERPQTDVKVKEPIDYNYTGQIHNKGLHEVFNHLEETRTRLNVITLKEIPPQKRNEEIKISTIKFIEKQNVPKEVIDFTEVQLDKTLIIDESINYIYTAPKNIFPSDFERAKSSLLTEKLEILNDIISDDDQNITSLLSRISKLEDSASIVLSEEDASILFSATATAKYSLQYWYENINEWADLCGVSVTRAGKFNWKQVGKEDIKGAIASATALGFARFLGPIGWKAWLIGIGGGALGSSAADAVGQLIDMIGENKNNE